MKLGVLFSGGKDSTHAAWLVKREGHEIACLLTIHSENKDSYMFHTPSISKTEAQARAMELPLLIGKTKGGKESELKDLERLIRKAKEEYKIEGIVTGALCSEYQASRIQKICDKLKLECINPLWQKDQIELLEKLVKNKFRIIIIGVAAQQLDASWLGRKIDKRFISEARELQEKYKINPAGEGGEFETFVLYAPGLFKKPLSVKDAKISGKGNSWRMEIDVE